LGAGASGSPALRRPDWSGLDCSSADGARRCPTVARGPAWLRKADRVV